METPQSLETQPEAPKPPRNKPGPKTRALVQPPPENTAQPTPELPLGNDPELPAITQPALEEAEEEEPNPNVEAIAAGLPKIAAPHSYGLLPDRDTMHRLLLAMASAFRIIQNQRVRTNADYDRVNDFHDFLNHEKRKGAKWVKWYDAAASVVKKAGCRGDDCAGKIAQKLLTANDNAHSPLPQYISANGSLNGVMVVKRLGNMAMAVADAEVKNLAP